MRASACQVRSGRHCKLCPSLPPLSRARTSSARRQSGCAVGSGAPSGTTPLKHRRTPASTRRRAAASAERASRPGLPTPAANTLACTCTRGAEVWHTVEGSGRSYGKVCSPGAQHRIAKASCRPLLAARCKRCTNAEHDCKQARTTAGCTHKPVHRHHTMSISGPCMARKSAHTSSSTRSAAASMPCAASSSRPASSSAALPVPKRSAHARKNTYRSTCDATPPRAHICLPRCALPAPGFRRVSGGRNGFGRI